MSALVWCLVGLAAMTAEPGAPIPLEPDQFGRVSVRVRLGGEGPFRFLVDTGSSLSSVSARLGARLRMPGAGRVRATSAGLTALLPLVRPPVIRLGHRDINLAFAVQFEASGHHPLAVYDGILGQDVLRRFDYLIDVAAGQLWVDPPRRVLASLELAELGAVSRSGPLTLAGADDTRWVLDSGASDVVLFRGVSNPAGARAWLVSSVGSRRVALTGPGGMSFGPLHLRWDRAVVASARGRIERGLLPLSLFDAVHVDNRRGQAYLAARRGGGSHPDVAAHLRALEDDGGVARRPGRVADIAAWRAKRGEPPHLSRRRRDRVELPAAVALPGKRDPVVVRAPRVRPVQAGAGGEELERAAGSADKRDMDVLAATHFDGEATAIGRPRRIGRVGGREGQLP